ncbi:MAG: CCA tRNA nucleotidyltransferase [Synergistetes bacterium]|nr:CCA tRNA nucleotidyltransferase [Synergistota bacterium]
MRSWYRPFLVGEEKIVWLSQESIALSNRYGFRDEIDKYAILYPIRMRGYPMNGSDVFKLFEKHSFFPSIARLSFASLRARSRLFLVGGALRDLLLVGKICREPDLLIEGDVDSFLEFALKDGYHLREKTPFLTLKLEDENGFKFDISVCRKESYDAPGALPRVFPASLSEDLYRRDFTMNSMALTLTDPEKGLLYDPFFGFNDLKERVLRIIRPFAFLEDPTRIIRGIRLKARFSLVFDELTLKAMRIAVDKGALRWVGWVRIWRELEELFKEDKAIDGILFMENLGCWKSLGVKFGDFEKLLLRKVALQGFESDIDRVEFFTLVIFGANPDGCPERWAKLFQLPRRLKKSLLLAPLWRRLKKMSFNERYRFLREAGKSVVKLWSLCLEEDLFPLWESYNKARPILSEDEIEALVSGKGPEYGRIKMEILRLQLEEGINDKDEILRRLKERSV